MITDLDLGLDELEILVEGNDDTRETLYLQFAAWLCLGKIDYQTFQKISKWTGCYQYVLPPNRGVLASLRDLLYYRYRTDLFFLALLMSHIESNLNDRQQQMLEVYLTK